MSGDGGSSNWGGKRSHTFDNDGLLHCEEFLTDSTGNGMSSFEGGSVYMSSFDCMLSLENGKGDGGSSDWKNK
jgi:hypothetical protein